MKHTDQVEVTLKSDLLRNILVEQLDTVCSEALRSVGCPVDFFAAMFINFINLQQFCKFRVVYRGVQSPHQIIEVINTAICSLVNDPNIGCMVEKTRKSMRIITAHVNFTAVWMCTGYWRNVWNTSFLAPLCSPTSLICSRLRIRLTVSGMQRSGRPQNYC